MRSTGFARGGVVALIAGGSFGFLLLGAWQGLGQNFGSPVRFQVVQVIEQFVIDLEDSEQDEVPRYNTIAVADFDRDGVLDLAAVDNDEGLVTVYTGVGDGTFAGTVALEAGDVFSPVAVVAEDFTAPFESNGGAPDGNIDLFVLDEDGVVGLLIGDGAGGFSPPDQELEFVFELADFISGAVAADFDGDGNMDVAIADEDEVILVCNDDGTMVPCPTEVAILPGGTFLIDVLPGDFDGDGDIDLVTIDPEIGVAYLVYNDGTASFTVDDLGLPLYPEGTGIPPEGRMAGANFDSAGPDDFVVINNELFSDLNGRTFVGLGNGRFNIPSFSAPMVATGIVAADFSNDGVPDLVFSDSLSLSIIAGVASGDFGDDFGAESASEAGPVPGRRMSEAEVLLAADLDGDGLLDLVGLVADGTEIEVALNTTKEPTPTAVATPTSTPIATRPTVSQTPAIATPTRTIPAQPTATSPGLPTRTMPPPDFDDSSCAVVRPRPAAASGWSWRLLLAGVLIAARRRRKGRGL